MEEEAARTDQVKKVIVAVHGIGDQTRFATVQQVMAQFARYHGKASAVPLGRFHTKDGSVAIVSEDHGDLGFAEVYWADIPREIAKTYVLEDIKPWVRTVIGRVNQRDLATRKLTDRDARMAEEVLGEMVQTVGVLDRLSTLAEKMGFFSFDLQKVLVNYIDDVQIVAEFKQEGGKIGEVFASQMQKVHDQFKGAEEIYLVAHSEGTVVAFLGLLTALCQQGNPWISKVRGFMTFGSPIDKHLILWPELFEEFKQPCHELATPIVWHNYYDYGDPVGFELNTARARFAQGAWGKIFQFSKDNDHGFARYPLPGKAHNDYWQDKDVFGHFIRNVVYDGKVPPQPQEASFEKPPRSQWLPRAISWVVPYLGATAVLVCAVLLLYKAIQSYMAPSAPPEPMSVVAPIVGGFTCLLAGLTVIARVPRLTRIWYWRLFAALFFLGSVFGYRAIFDYYQINDPIQATGSNLVVVSLVVLVGVYLASTLVPRWGMRTLLVPGSIAVAAVIYIYVGNHPTAKTGELWPMLLAGAFFLYLWWLVALVFDLTFVWHRYIRMSGKVPILQYRELESRGSWPEEGAAPTGGDAMPRARLV